MLRCVLIVAALATLPTTAVLAQQAPRKFPANAYRGDLVVAAPPDVQLNGQPARLAPGARIRGENNLLMVSGTLAGGRWVVNYTRDASGAIADLWVLTAAERAFQPWPKSATEAAGWQFDIGAQRWVKP